MTPTASAIAACCAGLYGHPIVELIAGQSLHPGGLATTRRLLGEARLSPGARLLDAGCGLGASARLAAIEFELRVDACDVSASALSRAATLAESAGAGIDFRTASVLDLPYPRGAFAGVLAECVLSTTSRTDGLAELRRVTADGGVLLLSDVTATETVGVPEPLAGVMCLTGAWRPGELDEVLGSAGYRIERGWDETDGVSSLLDRLEGRISLLGAVARDTGTLERLGDFGDFGDGFDQIGDRARVDGMFQGIRQMLREGRIGYRAVVARAI